VAYDDLSALDRTTLRVWRLLNLVCWGALGAAADLLLLATIALTYARLGPEILPAPVGFASVGAALIVAGAGAGTVVGANVYRFPGLVAGVATSLVAILVTSLVIPWPWLGGVAVMLAVLSVDVIAAVFVARRRWRRRPGALRAMSAA
jgi:hypothetical protein